MHRRCQRNPRAGAPRKRPGTGRDRPHLSTANRARCRESPRGVLRGGVEMEIETPFPGSPEDWIDEDYPVRAVEAVGSDGPAFRGDDS